MVSFGLSLLAEWYWFFDLFSHFANQYMVGGFSLFFLLLLLKKYKHATICLAIALFTLAETRFILQNPLQFFSPYETESMIEDNRITIVQYNHNIRNTDLNAFLEWVWINQNKTNLFDIIVLQEASRHTASHANELRKLYPHQIHEHRNTPFGMVLLSKHPIEHYQIMPFDGMPYRNFLLRAKINTPKASVTVYALHAIPPGGRISSRQRNKELEISANKIANDISENIIFIGDWNLTPTSPHFHKLKKKSKLEFQSFGLFLNPTWANNHYFNFLKIPIDHVMHSTNMRVLEKTVGSAFGSDHQTLITTLGIMDN